MALKHTTRAISRPALLRGLGTGLALVGPSAGLSALLAHWDSVAAGPLKVVLFVAILVSFGVAGARAASTASALPFTHGAIVGLLTFTVVQAGILLVSGVVGREGPISGPALFTNALLASFSGMIGARLMSRSGASAQERMESR